MALDLAYIGFENEGKPPLVILHGLLGSSRNWRWMARSLAQDFEVFALDLRNHGKSPAAESMAFDDLVADVRHWIQKRNLNGVTLMGHSLGGKVGMRLACRHGSEVGALIIVDVSPKPYPILHGKIFEAMASIDPSKLSTRAEADILLEPIIGHKRLQQFILSNLARDGEGKFRWQVNHETLSKNQVALAMNPLNEGDQYHGPVLFIRGENSGFLPAIDMPIVNGHFPKATLVAIPGAGHNPHIDNKTAFQTEVRKFGKQILGA